MNLHTTNTHTLDPVLAEIDFSLADDEMREAIHEAAILDYEENAHAPRQPKRTDEGNAELFAQLNEGRVRFDHKQQRWLIWNGHRWQPDKTGQVWRLATKVAKKRFEYAVNAPHETKEEQNKRDALFKFACRCENRVVIAPFLETAKYLPSIGDDGHRWDADPWLFGVANGVLDLRTGKLRQVAAKEEHVTKFSPVAFDPSARCPTFLKFLADTFNGDEELIDFIHKACGYTLTGSAREQCLFACWGLGSNGKSTLFKIFAYIMGDYSVGVKFSALLKKQYAPVGEGYSLYGARFASASETRKDLELDEGHVKQLTGDDGVTVNPKYREEFTFQPTHKLWIAFNHKPKITDNTHSMWRRVRLIPFTNKVEGNSVDKGLGDKLKAEASGILNWMVEGCLAWQEAAGGLDTPKAVEEATSQYRKESDPLADFLDSCCEVGKTDTVKKGEFRKCYEGWCKKNDEEPLNREQLKSAMLEQFTEGKDKEGDKAWKGLKLTVRPDAFDEYVI